MQTGKSTNIYSFIYLDVLICGCIKLLKLFSYLFLKNHPKYNLEPGIRGQSYNE